MEVQLSPDMQARLDQLSGETGRSREEFVSDALAGYFDELAQLRGLLGSRYDDLKNGHVSLVSSEEARVRFREKSATRHS